MATIAVSTFVHDITVAIRDILLTNVTDPLGAARTSNSKFVMTSYPERPVNYPLITVISRNVNALANLGFRSESVFYEVPVEIRIWARNMLEMDQLTDSVLNQLRTRQIVGGGAGTIDSNLFDFKLTSSVIVAEEGKQGIKSRILMVRYTFVATG